MMTLDATARAVQTGRRQGGEVKRMRSGVARSVSCDAAGTAVDTLRQGRTGTLCARLSTCAAHEHTCWQLVVVCVATNPAP